MRRVETALVAGAMLLAAVGFPARAAELRGSGRLQSALVGDDNVLEATAADGRYGDASLRLLGDGRLAWDGLLFGSRAEVSLRGLSESFRDHPAEDRRQGEAALAWDVASATARHRLALEAGYGLRAYPDSSSRGHHRSWGRVTGAVPVGPRGSLVGRLDMWQLDFRSTPRVDQTGAGFDLSYEHPLGRRLVLQGGLELSGLHYGFKSLRIDRGLDPPAPALGADRRDQRRFLHLGFRRSGRLVLQAQVGYRMQASNSIDGAFHRPEATWLVSWPLRWRVIGQFYGSIEHTKYTDRALRDFLVPRTGEIEAGEDDNTIAFRLARPLGRDWDLDARVGWYRNEALLVGVYYRKRVISLGFSRSFGSSSGS
jgi:hypothetical protein